MDEELENLKKKRLAELQQQAAMQQDVQEQQEQQKEQFEKQKKAIMRSIMTNKARERLANIKMARPEVAESLENQIIMAAQSGQLKNKINDEQLRMLLQKIMPKKRDIKIKRR
jgi:programmed cell death protein 5